MEIQTINTGNYKATIANNSWLSNILGGEPDKVSSTAAAYAYVPLCFRAARLRMSSVAKAPVKVYAMDGETEKDWPFETPPRKMLQMIEIALSLRGAAFFTPVTRGVQVVDWEYLNPFDITVTTEKTEKDGYVIEFTQSTTGEKWINIPRRRYYEMLYINEVNPQNPYLPGASMGASALGDSQLVQYLQVFASKFFEGGAMPVTLLAMDNISSAEISRVENWFKRSATAVKNAFRVLGVQAGVIKPTVLTQPVKDLVIPELHEQARKNVALAFEIPQTMLEDAANFATAAEHHQAFYEDTVIPRSDMIWDAINKQALGKLGLYAEQDFDSLSIFQEDEEKRVRIAQTHYNINGDVMLSYELAGIILTEEQVAKLEAQYAEKEERAAEMEEQMQPNDESEQDEETQEEEDMKRWKKKAIKAIKAGKSADVPFESEYIDQLRMEAIKAQLIEAQTVEDVVSVFDSVPAGDIVARLDQLIKAVSVEQANE
jgi:hypothetical protein